MQSRTAEPTPHVGHRPGPVQRSQRADPVDDQERSRFIRNAEAYRTRKARNCRTSLDCLDAGFGRLVGYKDELGLRMATPDRGECREKYRFVLWPGGTGNHCRCAPAESE
jgi:hypothetical protein